MGQVNVAYDDDLLTKLDCLAAARGLSRPDLLRAIAEEAVRASEQGRPMFEPPEAPIDADTALVLATKLERLGIDFDRLARSSDRREKKLLESFNATDEANRSAYERLSEDLAGRFREGATPFAKMLTSFREDVAKLHSDVLAASRKPDSLNAIQKDLAAIRSAQDRVRPITHLHLFRDVHPNRWLWGIIVTFGLSLLMFLQILFANLLPNEMFATPVALRLYGSADTGICELYKTSRRLKHCPSLAPAETGGRP